MALSRSAIKSGPCILQFNGGTVYFKNGATIEEVVETWDAEADAFLAADKRVKDRYVLIKGTPSGQWTNLGVWFAWLSAARGARLFGSSDVPAVVWFLDGDKFTYHCAGLRTMPDLVLSSTRTTMDGQIEIECRTKNNTAASSANSLFTRGTDAFDDTSFAWEDILSPVYTAAWGSSPWDAFHTREGFRISARPSWNDITADGLGVVEKELDTLAVSVSFAPIGIAQSDIDSKLLTQGASGALIGSRVAGRAADLNISGTGIYVRVRNAFAQKVTIQGGTSGRARHGDIEAVATLGITDGAAIAQLYLGDAAPV